MKLTAETVAGTGQLSLSLTREKNPEKGVALSRARAHQIRPTCKMLGIVAIGKGTTYSEKSSDDANHDGEPKNQEQAKGATAVPRGLKIDHREGERAVAGQDSIEICDCIKDRDSIAKSSCALHQLRNIGLSRQDALRLPKMICAATALGMSLAGFGSSSAMCVTASGVPMVNAPLSTPVKKETPLLQPA